MKRDGAKMQYWELALFSFILLSCYAGSFFLLLLFLLPRPPPLRAALPLFTAEIAKPGQRATHNGKPVPLSLHLLPPLPVVFT